MSFKSEGTLLTPLMVVCKSQRFDETVLKLLFGTNSTLTSDDKYKLLFEKAKNGFNAFHFACQNQSKPEYAIQILNLFQNDANILKQLLLAEGEYHRLALDTAICRVRAQHILNRSENLYQFTDVTVGLRL